MGRSESDVGEGFTAREECDVNFPRCKRVLLRSNECGLFEPCSAGLHSASPEVTFRHQPRRKIVISEAIRREKV